MTMVLAAIAYLDRVAISVTRPHIARDLDLSPTQMGYVFSAFYMAYALFEIPTGWWGDKVGTRKVLTRIVCWWSAFTVLTGAAFSYSSLLAIRFLSVRAKPARGPMWLGRSRAGSRSVFRKITWENGTRLLGI